MVFQNDIHKHLPVSGQKVRAHSTGGTGMPRSADKAIIAGD